jgi:hypothetical protein
MNPKDEISIAALVADFDGSLVVSGRIVGVNSSKRLSEREWPSDSLLSGISRQAIGSLVGSVLFFLFLFAVDTFFRSQVLSPGR